MRFKINRSAAGLCFGRVRACGDCRRSNIEPRARVHAANGLLCYHRSVRLLRAQTGLGVIN